MERKDYPDGGCIELTLLLGSELTIVPFVGIVSEIVLRAIAVKDLDRTFIVSGIIFATLLIDYRLIRRLMDAFYDAQRSGYK